MTELDQTTYASSLLYKIPVYRLLLYPRSLLRENNTGVHVRELINSLPNSKNIKHEQQMWHKTSDDQIKYFDSYLLLESKVFCSMLLTGINKHNDENKTILLNNDLKAIWQILEEHRLPFFKFLLLNDLKRFRLSKGKMLAEVEQALTIDEAIKQVKKYAVLPKLINALIAENNLLYGH
jgi:hypothetical protein